MSLGSRASTVLTLAMVGGVCAAIYWAVSSSKTMVTCEMAPGATELRGRAIYYIDFGRQVMASTEGDRPVVVSAGEVTWDYATETGRINRRSGALVIERKVVAASGTVDKTLSTGKCTGLK